MPPTVNSVSPSQGPVSGGTTAVITGTSLIGATAVRFGTVNAASYTVNSSTQITAVTPPGTSLGPVPVTVVSPTGTSNATVSFTYTAVLPTVTGVSPSSGPASGGTTVTLSGTNFTGASAVRFGTTNAVSFTVTSPTRITAVSPPGGPGATPVTVTTPSGTSADSPSAYFYYTPVPVLTGLSATAGPANGGNDVTLRGQNLSNATAVKFGASTAAFTIVSSTEVRVQAPPGSGITEVTVTTPGGVSNPLAYAYVSAPTLSGIAPSAGPASGGTTVTLTGTGFATTTSVTFGSSTAAFIVLSDQQLTATVPAGAPGSVPVRVTTVGGTSGAVTFSRVEPPIT